MKKPAYIIIAVAVAAAVAVSLFLYINRENTVSYRTEAAVWGGIMSAISAAGTVNPVKTVLVGTQASGTIKDIYADFNSQVKKGQVIARIDPAAFEAQVEQARANLASAKAGLMKSNTLLVDAKRTMERQRMLFSRGLIAKSESDTSETNYEAANAEAAASVAKITQAEAALRLSETNLRYTAIESPVSGIVVSRNVDVGQTVAASFQTPTLFTIAEDLSKMQINCNVVEADIGRVKEGQMVEFTVDAYPESIFNGHVSEVRNAPIIVQNVVAYDVVVKVENPRLMLKPGMTANVRIITAVRKDVVKLPNAALRFTPPDARKENAGQKGKAVWIVENNKPKRLPVTIGISDGSFTEMVSGDVRQGQELIAEVLAESKSKAQQAPRLF
ncbi:MAG: efflux RND transporter periplasmic adaptor subunit [Deltaproteobacteria bacterium]|nr:efflux RND transporter periplasmic adaptor subunit [Deltaproteobacteria bacterium]